LQRYLVEEDAGGENSEELLKNDSFAFDERLDVAYLRKLYSDNCNYAISLFHIFLEYMESDWEEIQQAVKNKDWQQLTNLVHKVKPNFSMVGLTWITAMMQDVYKKLKADNHASAIPLLQEVQKEFDQYMPLIRDELERMQQIVKQ
jgi:HPt (histidine-containing phosphotransfer) domain-containing protein